MFYKVYRCSFHVHFWSLLVNFVMDVVVGIGDVHTFEVFLGHIYVNVLLFLNEKDDLSSLENITL